MHVRRRPASARTALLVARRSLAERWRSLAAWTTGIVLISVMQLAVYPSVASTSREMATFVQSWPEALREAFGLADYTSGPGYLNAELFTFVVPLVLIGVAGSAGAAATAGEEERGTADLLLALPLRRAAVLAGKVLAMVAATVLVGAALAVTLLVGAPLADLSVSTGGVLAAVTASALLALAFGGVALLLGALTGHRGTALGVAMGLAIAAFLLQALAPLAEWLEPWQPVSPFHWAYADRPLAGGLDGAGAALLGLLAVVTVLAAGAVFTRRDVGTG